MNWSTIIDRIGTLQREEMPRGPTQRTATVLRIKQPGHAPKIYDVRKPVFPDLPTSAHGAGGIGWSRWAGESAEEFRARVKADAERLGVNFRFERGS